MPGQVSVIIPNYNNAPWIQRCIESAIQQGPELLEIIVVDDHSTDNSLEIIEALQKENIDLIKVYTNPEKGANSARNYGMSQCRGEFIQWLDSDDMLLPGKFEHQMQAFRDQQCDIVYSDWRLDYYEKGEFVRSESRKCKPQKDYLFELLADHWTCSHNYLLSRRIAIMLHEAQAWNPATKVSQDREYFTMAALLGARFTYLSGEYSVYNRWTTTTVSSISFHQRIEVNMTLIRRFRKYLLENSIPAYHKYLSILDIEILKSKFHHPGIRFDHWVFPWIRHYKYAHWKMRFWFPWLLLKGNLQFLFQHKK